MGESDPFYSLLEDDYENSELMDSISDRIGEKYNEIMCIGASVIAIEGVTLPDKVAFEINRSIGTCEYISTEIYSHNGNTYLIVSESSLYDGLLFSVYLCIILALIQNRSN